MKRLLICMMLVVSIATYAQKTTQDSCPAPTCCNSNSCDSTNIPVLLVDGVEVTDLQGIAPDDIKKVEVIKDPAITRIFSPRLGGVVLITTKSKKFLQPILDEYDRQTEEQKKQRIPGELIIR